MNKKSTKKIVTVAVLLCLTLTSLILTACDGGKTEMEQDMSVDLKSDVGLYFWGDDGGNAVRYSENIGAELFDKNKPTIIFFHGWMPDEDKNTANINYTFATTPASKKKGIDHTDYAARLRDKGYNVGAMYWAKHAQSLTDLFEYIWIDFKGQKHSLACIFAKEYAKCFGGYSGEMTFMGHSFGSQASTATAYMLYKMKEKGLVSAETSLPSRITVADPYIGDLAISDKSLLNKNVDNIEESIGGRIPAALTADVIEYLSNKGVVSDIYCGMPIAYDQFSENDTVKRNAIIDKLHKNSVWTVLEGLQSAYGKVGDIHNLTLDWVALSLFVVKEGDDGERYPTAGLDTASMKELIGKKYKSTYKGLDLEEEMLEEVE